MLSVGLLVRACRRRGVSWVKAHVSVAPRPGPGATFELHPGDGHDRDHVLTVVPLEINSSTTLEETDNDVRDYAGSGAHFRPYG
jgi:hypothetical protein